MTTAASNRFARDYQEFSFSVDLLHRRCAKMQKKYHRGLQSIRWLDFANSFSPGDSWQSGKKDSCMTGRVCQQLGWFFMQCWRVIHRDASSWGSFFKTQNVSVGRDFTGKFFPGRLLGGVARRLVDGVGRRVTTPVLTTDQCCVIVHRPLRHQSSALTAADCPPRMSRATLQANNPTASNKSPVCYTLIYQHLLT